MLWGMADVRVKRPDCVGGGLSGPSYEVTPHHLWGPLSRCHQARLSSGLHELLWPASPAQARLSQISLSLINQNIHLSRDILFIIAGSFIGGRSGGLRVRRVGAENDENGFLELDMSRISGNTAETTDAQCATN